MSREEAAATAISKIEDGVTPPNEIDRLFAREALAAADAHDAAEGVRRVTLDDATVERAARALAGTVFMTNWEDMKPWTQRAFRRDARDVLAAAIEDRPDA